MLEVVPDLVGLGLIAPAEKRPEFERMEDEIPITEPIELST